MTQWRDAATRQVLLELSPSRQSPIPIPNSPFPIPYSFLWINGLFKPVMRIILLVRPSVLWVASQLQVIHL